MSKIDKIIINGDNVLALVWESEIYGTHVVVQNGLLDLNNPLIVEERTDKGFQKTKTVDLADFFSEILMRE